MNLRKSIIALDLVLLIMSITWTLYTLVRGIDWIEMIYIYVYFILVFIGSILNLKILIKINKDGLK